ncbi:hypothetical protein JL722_6487 [Aureococcus anophagefferens]|nr:hypothetical protein JL722_6487 [Aureococcus anophagefferens]
MASPARSRSPFLCAFGFLAAAAVLSTQPRRRAAWSRLWTDPGATIDANLTRAWNASKSDWWTYKVTHAVPPGAYLTVVPFVKDAIAPIEVTCLGCAGVKSYAELGDGVGLHWVEAPALTTGDVTLVEWVTFFERVVNATIAGEAWNAFMHNRVSLYTSPENFVRHVRAIRARGVPLLKRRSLGYEGYGRTDVAVAHAQFAIAGRIYEIAAPMRSAGMEALAGDWALWGDDECEAAQRLAYDDVEKARRILRGRVRGRRGDGAELGPAAPMQPTVAVLGGDACAVARVSHEGAADAYGPVTYVENRAARGLAGASDFEYTVADYGAYVEKVHAHTGASNEWKWGANWDHFMDDHVGFQYRGSSDCSNDTVSLLEYFDARLRADGVAICACNRENNGNIWALEMGTACESTC